MSQKVREGKHQHLGNHGLIKLIVLDSFRKYRIHIIWSKFIDINRETFIETQTLKPGETPTSSVGGKEGKTEEEEEEARIEEEELVG